MTTDARIYQCPVTQQFYDPLAVRRALTLASRPAGFNAALQDSRSADEAKQADGEARVIAATRAALGLPAIDAKTGKGVPDQVVLDAITAFTRWLAGKGPRPADGSIGAPCTDCQDAR